MLLSVMHDMLSPGSLCRDPVPLPLARIWSAPKKQSASPWPSLRGLNSDGNSSFQLFVASRTERMLCILVVCKEVPLQ